LPSALHSSYDRGFDIGHAEVSTASHPVIERRVIPKGRKEVSWKKYVAFSMVAVMIASGFVMVAPALGLKAPDKTQAPQTGHGEWSLGGAREVTWTYSHFGESYKKSTNNALQGQSTSIDGINQWWYLRQNYTGYGDCVFRATYPEITINSPYGSKIAWSNIAAGWKAAFFMMSFYREDVVANNITTIGTGIGQKTNFVPMLNSAGLTMSGGALNWSYYCQYTTQKESDDIYNGTHFANTYFGVPALAIDTRPGSATNYNDGYYYQVAGTIDFNVAAAKKFLNLPGVADLPTEFTTANSVGATAYSNGAVATGWHNTWDNDGCRNGTMDIYAAYEYETSAYPWWCWLTLDSGASTANHLVLRLWSIAWGTDMLMNRYLDVAGVMSKQNTYQEDAYINGTAIPGYSRIVARMVESYHLTAWADPVGHSAAWMLAPWHVDYDPNTPQGNSAGPPSAWLSRYNQYNGVHLSGGNEPNSGPVTWSWAPGNLEYGYPVLYWNPLNNWNLTTGEKIVIKLGNRPMLGITPYEVTTPDDYLITVGHGASAHPAPDPAKMAELSSHFVWGELTMGNGFPGGSGLKQYYNGATKTLTITGPKNFQQNKNNLAVVGSWTSLNLTASPNFIFDVSRVSDYTFAMVEPGPTYSTGVTYHMTVTAKNFTSVTVVGWNGTVNITVSAGVTIGGVTNGVYQAKYGSAGNGVLTVTVVFGTTGAHTVGYNDLNNSLDVSGSFILNTSGGVIPEFPTLLIPAMGIMAVVVVTLGRRERRKRDQEDEE